MISCFLNPIYSFFRSSSREEPQASPILKFVSEESPKTWVQYENYSDGRAFLGFRREENDYETPQSWRNLENQMEEKVFAPLDKKFIEVSKELRCNSEENSILYCSAPFEVGIILEPRSQGKELKTQERCQLTINRIAIEKLLEMQLEYGIKKEEIREQLQRTGINLNKYYDTNQERLR